MKKALLGVLVIGLLVAADDKKADDIKDKLKGTWDVVGMKFGDKKATEADIKGQTLTFDGDKMTHEEKGKKETTTFKIDSTKKPMEIDMTPTEGPEKGKTMKGIIEVKDDMLKIAFKMKPEDRPTGYDDKDAMVITLKKKK